MFGMFTRQADDTTAVTFIEASAEAGLTLEATGEKKLPTVSGTVYTGGLLNLAKFDRPVVIDLAGVEATADPQPLLRDHDALKPLGQARPVVTAEGLMLEAGSITQVGKHATEITAASKNGHHWQASIGGHASDIQPLEAGETLMVNGRAVTGPAYIARGFKWAETSVVGAGADLGGTRLEIAASANGWHTDPVQAAGQRQQILANYSLSEAERMTIEQEALTNNWTPTELATTAIRTSRPSLGHIEAAGSDASVRFSRPDNVHADGRLIEAALLRNAGFGLEELQAEYPADIAEAAMHDRFNGFKLQAAMRACVRQAGHDPDRMGTPQTSEFIRAAFSARFPVQAASGFSTVNTPDLLANVQNKAMLRAYNSTPVAWQQICRPDSIGDFKPAKRVRLTMDGLLKEIGGSGEIESTELTDDAYANQLTTFARRIALSRQMIVDDDLQGLLQMPRLFGRQAALTIEHIVFTVLLSNPTLDDGNPVFASARNNLLTGAGSALSSTSLSDANRQFWKLTDTAGHPVLIEPKKLLVPPEIHDTAIELIESRAIVFAGGGGNEQRPNANVHAGRFAVVPTPYLSSTAIDNSNLTAWYLLADPMDGIGIMDIAFLNGRRGPTIEADSTSFETLGTQWRCYLDFGVAFADFRAGVRADGQ